MNFYSQTWILFWNAKYKPSSKVLKLEKLNSNVNFYSKLCRNIDPVWQLSAFYCMNTVCTYAWMTCIIYSYVFILSVCTDYSLQMHVSVTIINIRCMKILDWNFPIHYFFSFWKISKWYCIPEMSIFLVFFLWSMRLVSEIWYFLVVSSYVNLFIQSET